MQDVNLVAILVACLGAGGLGAFAREIYRGVVGNPASDRVVVVGQSAGAHLSATAILRQAEWELSGYGLASAWSPSSLAGFVGVSGVYNPDDQGLVNHFHRRGLHKEVFHSIMEAGYSGARAEEALPRASPCAILRDQAGVPGLVARQPPVLLCHGSADTSAPPSESAKFAKALRAAGVESVSEKYYPGKTHTDPFVTDPILGGHDALLEDIVGCRGCRAVGALDDDAGAHLVGVALAVRAEGVVVELRQRLREARDAAK